MSASDRSRICQVWFKEAKMIVDDLARSSLPRLVLAIAASALVGAGVGIGGMAPAAAYEVWLPEQSDTAKESGVFLYMHDGATLAANPAAANTAVTIQLSCEL